MPVDSWELLEWMVARESSEPSRPTIFGTEFLDHATQAGLARDDNLAWDATARAAAHLKRLRYISWSYVPHPNVDRPEPSLKLVDSAFLQRVQEIHVTTEGHAALTSRQKADTGAQINIVNSTVGQVALGDIKNIDIFVVLDAMERSLDAVDGFARGEGASAHGDSAHAGRWRSSCHVDHGHGLGRSPETCPQFAVSALLAAACSESQAFPNSSPASDKTFARFGRHRCHRRHARLFTIERFSRSISRNLINYHTREGSMSIHWNLLSGAREARTDLMIGQPSKPNQGS